MNVFLKKIFKSFPDRQNFKIFPQRACKHLQNTKKYVIINKLISITIKNGLMVKRLRRCPLTAESAVRFRMGLPKKYSTTLCGAVFFCMPLSGTTRQLVAVVRICVSKFCRRLPSPALLPSCRLHMGNGNFRMGRYYFGARNDAATCLPSFVFASANFAVVLRFTEVKKIRKGMQTETAISAWGYILLRCAETTRQLVCRRSSICASKFLP